MLFICTCNLARSPTAEQLYKNREDLETKSA
ncbi:MAG: phosphotyrosine protein phosphatase, partial [Promethearchaeota archaeon]